MSFIKYIDGVYYYDNPVLNFSSGSNTYVVADSVNTPPIEEDGKYMLDYTMKVGGSQTNRKHYVRILVNAVKIDEWIKESKDVADRLPFTGVSKPLDFLTGVQNITIEARVDNPADVFIDSFRFSLKKWQ